MFGYTNKNFYIYFFLKMAKKTGEVVTTKFVSGEIGLMLFALRFTSFDINPSTGNFNERRFEKLDELVALETFKELKKAIDEKGVLADKSLVFGTANKALLIKCIDEIKWGLGDMEFKLSLEEKLK